MHYYKFHIGDFRGATAHLTNEEDLAYRRLLDWYYDTEQPIPKDTQMVARRLRVGNDSVTAVLTDFFSETEDGWRHERCDIELSGYLAKADANRENGRKGGRPKSINKTQENPDGCQAKPAGNPEESEPNLNHKPPTTNQEPKEDQKNLSPKAKAQKSRSKIPDPFMLTAEMRAWAAESAPAVNLKNETEAFVDYWRGEAKTKADWPATWRNWIRRAQIYMNSHGRRGSGSGLSKQEQIQAANQRVVDEIIARQSAGGDQVDFDLGDPIVIEGEVIRAH